MSPEEWQKKIDDELAEQKQFYEEFSHKFLAFDPLERTEVCDEIVTAKELKNILKDL